MSARHALATSLAACHLLLVACGACGLSLPDCGLASRAIGNYGVISGADSQYGFFAPVVDSQLRASFLLSDDAGRSRTETLARGGGREVELRVDSIVTSFYLAEFCQDLRRDFTASWAATMFGRRPETRRVVARVELYDIPTMDQYRSGFRPRWWTVYEATFAQK